MEKLYHVVPSIEYKEQAIEYINEFYKYNSEINGVGSLNKYLDNYEEWLLKLEKDRQVIPNEERVPAETYFLVRANDNKIVGMINIRLALNNSLRRIGGHIGYSIRPSERRKGYNKINLYLGLLRCQESGIEEVLMSCNKNNPASAKSMLAFGAKLDKEWYCEERNNMIQNYLIDVNQAISDAKDIYEPKVYRK